MNKHFKRFLIFLCALLIIIPVGYGAYLFATTKIAIDKSYDKKITKSDLRLSGVNPSKDNVSILILGIDDNVNRQKNGQSVDDARTDAMIYTTLNRENKKIRLVSVPRDTLAYIPAVGYFDKITHAHAEGGPEMSVATVERMLNAPVDYYVRINMEAFVEVVDTLGGIEFDVPFDMNEPATNDKGRMILQQGKQHLNGDQALAVARSRKMDSDFARGQRQMELIQAIFKKAKTSGSINKLDELVDIAGNNAKHNFSFNNITSLASYYASDDVTFVKEQIKGTDNMYNGVYYFNPDLEYIYNASKRIHQDLGITMPEESEFIDYQVKSVYGDITPLQALDLEQLKLDFDTFLKNSTEAPVMSDENGNVISTEAPFTESPYEYDAPDGYTTEAPSIEPFPSNPAPEDATIELPVQ